MLLREKREERMRENVEAGIQCPECGSYDVTSVTELTGRVDAGTMEEVFGCHECGYMDGFSAFQVPASVVLVPAMEVDF